MERDLGLPSPSTVNAQRACIFATRYADHGSSDDLLRSVAAFRSWAEARYEQGVEMFEGYLDDGGPFPDRLHLIGHAVARPIQAVELLPQRDEGGVGRDAHAADRTWSLTGPSE